MSFERITLENENSQTKVEVSTNNKGFRIYKSTSDKFVRKV